MTNLLLIWQNRHCWPQNLVKDCVRRAMRYLSSNPSINIGKGNKARKRCTPKNWSAYKLKGYYDMQNFYRIILFFALTLNIGAQDLNNKNYQKFIWALGMVESGNDPQAVGDAGRAIGQFQIWHAYYQDAKEYSLKRNDKFKLKNTKYEDVRSPAVAHRVMRAYWSRYAPEALKNNNFEVLARIHNGGPTGHQKSSTKGYWNKVQRFMRQGLTEKVYNKIGALTAGY